VTRERCEEVAMADCRVPVDLFERGTCPPVCVLTGRDAKGETLEVTAQTAVGAAYLLLLLGVFPFLIYRLATQKTTYGELPLSNAGWSEIQQGRRRRRARRLAILGGASALLVLSIALAADTLALIAVLVLFAVLVWLFVSTGAGRWVPFQLTVERSGRWVAVEDCHEAFATAILTLVRST
jgi:hypothetical protein